MELQVAPASAHPASHLVSVRVAVGATSDDGSDDVADTPPAPPLQGEPVPGSTQPAVSTDGGAAASSSVQGGGGSCNRNREPAGRQITLALPTLQKPGAAAPAPPRRGATIAFGNGITAAAQRNIVSDQGRTRRHAASADADARQQLTITDEAARQMLEPGAGLRRIRTHRQQAPAPAPAPAAAILQRGPAAAPPTSGMLGEKGAAPAPVGGGRNRGAARHTDAAAAAAAAGGSAARPRRTSLNVGKCSRGGGSLGGGSGRHSASPSGIAWLEPLDRELLAQVHRLSVNVLF